MRKQVEFVTKSYRAGTVDAIVGQLGMTGWKDGQGSDALIYKPRGLCHHPETLDLWISDGNGRTVRRVDPKTSEYCNNKTTSSSFIVVSSHNPPNH